MKSDITKDSGHMISYKLSSHPKTSTSNSKGDIGHYRYQGPHLTLKEWPKVKCDRTIRFRTDDFP